MLLHKGYIGVIKFDDEALLFYGDVIAFVDINLIPITLAYEVISHVKELLINDKLRCYKEATRIESQYELDICYHRTPFGLIEKIT